MRFAYVPALMSVALLTLPLHAADEAPTRLKVQFAFYRGQLKEGREKAKKTAASSHTQSIGGRIGTSYSGSTVGRDIRIVPSLLEDDKAQRQADIARGVEPDSVRVGPSRSLTSGDRAVVELHAFRGDRVRGEVFLEVTEPAKGDEEELLTAGGTCIRKMGMFALGKTYQFVTPADSKGEATWLELTIERAQDDVEN
jgi:hypothetical protein